MFLGVCSQKKMMEALCPVLLIHAMQLLCCMHPAVNAGEKSGWFSVVSGVLQVTPLHAMLTF